MTFAGTFASLGMTPGTYAWTWSDTVPDVGVVSDGLTIQIGPTSVPDTGSTALLMAFGLAGLGLLHRKIVA